MRKLCSILTATVDLLAVSASSPMRAGLMLVTVSRIRMVLVHLVAHPTAALPKGEVRQGIFSVV